MPPSVLRDRDVRPAAAGQTGTRQPELHGEPRAQNAPCRDAGMDDSLHGRASYDDLLAKMAALEKELEKARRKTAPERVQARVGWQEIDVRSADFVAFHRALSQLLIKAGPLGTAENAKDLTVEEAWCVCGDVDELCLRYAARLHTDAVDLCLKGVSSLSGL